MSCWISAGCLLNIGFCRFGNFLRESLEVKDQLVVMLFDFDADVALCLQIFPILHNVVDRGFDHGPVVALGAHFLAGNDQGVAHQAYDLFF